MGQSLAKVSLVATMATLLQHFSFKLAEEVSSSYLLPAASCWERQLTDLTFFLATPCCSRSRHSNQIVR